MTATATVARLETVSTDAAFRTVYALHPRAAVWVYRLNEAECCLTVTPEPTTNGQSYSGDGRTLAAALTDALRRMGEAA